MVAKSLVLTSACAVLWLLVASAADSRLDYTQWRGSNRDGSLALWTLN